MPPKNQSNPFEKYQAELIGRYRADFQAKTRAVNSQLSKLVNKKIDRMMREMAVSFIGQNTMPGELAPFMDRTWAPLSKKHIQKKGGQTRFFEDTGDLRRTLSQPKSVSALFGGYSNKSARVAPNQSGFKVTRGQIENEILNVKTGKVVNWKNINQKLTFTVFGELSKRVVKETILDAPRGYKLTRPPTLRGEVLNDPISVKLGIYHKRRMRRYYRPLLNPFARYYVKFVIPRTVKNYLRNMQNSGYMDKL